LTTSKKVIRLSSALVVTLLLLTGCETGTSSSYCLLTRPEWIGSLDEAAFFDCNCSDDPVDVKCR